MLQGYILSKMVVVHVVFLSVYILLFSTTGTTAVFPSLAPPGLSDPTGPGAHCVNKSSLTLADLPDATCLNYITYDSIYMDDNQAARLQLGKLGLGGTFLPSACTFWAHRVFCVQTLRPCYEVADPISNKTVAVGGFSCDITCQNWGSNCYAILQQAVAAIDGTVPSDVAIARNCYPPWPMIYGNTTGYTVFPNTTSYNVTVSADNGTTYFTANIPTYCDVLSGNVSSVVTCPAGFHSAAADACTFDCPLPLLDNEQFDAITIMLSVVGWISLVATGFLLITLLLDPQKRQYPSVLSVYFTICVMYVSFSFCLGSMIGWREIGCEDEQTFNYFGDPGCTIQGLIFVYFTLASVLWWLVMAFNLFLIAVVGVPMRKLNWRDWLIGWKDKKEFRKSLFSLETLFICYHILCWVSPILPLIISVSNEKLGYGQDLWCTIHSNEEIIFRRTGTGAVEYSGGDPANLWNFLLLTLPILLAVALGVTLIVLVIIFGVIKTGWRFFIQQWRLFLFLFFYIWIYVFVFSFQIESGIVADDQYQAYADYLSCVFIREDAIAALGDTSIVCDLEQHVSFPLWFIVDFNEAAQGIMVFFIFGSSWRLFKSWYRLFTNPRAVLTSSTSSSTNNNAPPNSHSLQKISGKKHHTHSLNGSSMVDEVVLDDDEDSSSNSSSSNYDDEEEDKVVDDEVSSSSSSEN